MLAIISKVKNNMEIDFFARYSKKHQQARQCSALIGVFK
jgi:hypothetical protein